MIRKKKPPDIINSYEANMKKVIEEFKFKLDIHLSKTHIDNGIQFLKNFITLIHGDNCIPFWNNRIKKISDSIFLPIEKNIIRVKQPQTFSSNTCFQTEHYKSKTNKKRLAINEIKNAEQKVMRTVKIKIYPTPMQKEYFKRVYGAYRYFYNRTIQYINNYDKSTHKTKYMINRNDPIDKHIIIDLSKESNKISLIVCRKLLKNNYPIWMNLIPIHSHLIDKAINEAIDNYYKCIEAFKRTGKPFKLKMKTKKNKYQTMNIEKTMIRGDTIFKNIKYYGEYIFRKLITSNKLSDYQNITDSSITYIDKLDEFYINLGYKKTITINRDNKICAVDPGLSCFNVCYSDNEVHKIGIGFNRIISKNCKEVDIMTSRIYKKKDGKYKYNYHKRRNIKKALHRKIKKIQKKKEELHNKTVKFLTDKYGRILMPPFETQKMAQKAFNSKLARSLYNVSFFKFLLKLRSKCKEKGIELIEDEEYYTSKTCTKCGKINRNLTLNDRTYKCNGCGLIIDRDINGARNIMLRNNKWELPPLNK